MTPPKKRGTPVTTTAKMLRFAAEYMVDQNQTAAAIRAGYSERTAKQIGYKLMKKPAVRKLIDAAIEEQMKRLRLDADSVLANIHRVAYKAEKAGQFAAAIRGHELIGKNLKLFTETHEHGGIGGGPIQMTVTPTDEAL